jgi:hypothetical protein
MIWADEPRKGRASSAITVRAGRVHMRSSSENWRSPQSCACGSSGAAVCGAGGVVTWERGAGKGREGAEGVDVDYALARSRLVRR